MDITLGMFIFLFAIVSIVAFCKIIMEDLHMWFTKKQVDEVMTALDKVNETSTSEPPKPEEPEEWIWVDGYKATERDMKCRDYQYYMNEQHDMPDGTEIKDCESGFHLCRDLDDVFKYYDICNGRRYFRVRALVRKTDYEEYGHTTREYKEWERQHSDDKWYMRYYGAKYRYKLAARSIIFLSELTPDEILAGRINVNKWSDEYKKLALEVGVDNAYNHMITDELVSLGYSYPFAQHIVASKKYDLAVSVASQPDLSMDMKCWLIFK